MGREARRIRKYIGGTFGNTLACTHLANVLNVPEHNHHGGKVSKFIKTSGIGFNDLLNTKVMTQTLLTCWLHECLSKVDNAGFTTEIHDLYEVSISDLIKYQDYLQ